MLHPTVITRPRPDDAARGELEALGLGDPTVSLHRLALRDFYVVALVFLAAFLIAVLFDLGDLYRAASARHEHWEYDEIFVAALFTLVAFCWFAWRQWRRYADEITRRLKLEESLVEMQVMTDHLGENKAAFLATLGHDLRTPLNGIYGFAQFLEEEPFGPIGNERYKQYIKSIRESAALLDERIATCLDPEKVEFGAEPLQMRPWPIAALVEQALPIVASLAQSADIAIRLDLAHGLPQVHADHRAIKKILVNLVTNAIKFNRPNGTVLISATLTADKALALTVEDNGVGVTADALDPRWVQRDAAPAPARETVGRHGLDVGLTVVKKLLELHGASLTIQSVAQKGTKVTMIFPPDRMVLERPSAHRKLA
jgi:signal transduction histidine kinase